MHLRACGGQFAHLVCSFAQLRMHAVLSGCKPTLSFCFPKQAGIPSPVLCGGEETRRAKAPAHPPHTETPEKLSFAPLAFRAFPMPAGGLRPKGR